MLILMVTSIINRTNPEEVLMVDDVLDLFVTLQSDTDGRAAKRFTVLQPLRCCDGQLSLQDVSDQLFNFSFFSKYKIIMLC